MTKDELLARITILAKKEFNNNYSPKRRVFSINKHITVSIYAKGLDGNRGIGYIRIKNNAVHFSRYGQLFDKLVQAIKYNE